MPRFFINLTDGERFDAAEGIELPDSDGALKRAGEDLRQYAAQVMGDDARLDLNVAVEVTNEEGKTVGTVDLDSVVDIRNR